MYDVIILGGGPSGCAAAVYASRKKLKTLLVTESFGGQSIVSDSIENWIGEINISGWELAQKLESHVRAQKEIETKSPETVTEVAALPTGFNVITKGGDSYETRTVIVATGGRHRRLAVPGEEKFQGRGVAYCSTCDAPLYKDKVVAVVGAGNAGLEAVIDLTPYADKIYLLNRRQQPKGDPSTLEDIKKHSDQVVILNSTIITEIHGDQTVSSITIKNTKNDRLSKIKVDGVFVEIGTVPNGEAVTGLVETNVRKEIVVDHRTGATSRPGVFAAGDVTDAVYKQSNIAAGDAVKAALSAYQYIISLRNN